MIVKSEKRVCVCDEVDKKIVFVDTVTTKGHEIETLEILYCMTCNSTWAEA